MTSRFRRGEGASPPRRNRSLPGRYGVFVVAAAALAFALVLARGATWGPGLDLKSVDYLRVADNLLDGEGFTLLLAAARLRGHSSRGVTPYVSWPPLYPLLLAAARLLGLDPLSGIHLPGAALFALAVFVVGRYAGRRPARPRGAPSAGGAPASAPDICGRGSCAYCGRRWSPGTCSPPDCPSSAALSLKPFAAGDSSSASAPSRRSRFFRRGLPDRSLQRRAVLRANSAEVLPTATSAPWASSLGFARAEAYGSPAASTPTCGRGLRQSRLGAGPSAWFGSAREAGADLPQERLAAFLEGVPEGARFVWSTNFRQPDYRDRPPALLFATSGLRPLAEFADGAVFAVDRGYAPPSHRYREAYEFLRTKEPDAEADFELYLDRGSASAAKGPTLFYRRASCRKSRCARSVSSCMSIPRRRGSSRRSARRTVSRTWTSTSSGGASCSNSPAGGAPVWRWSRFRTTGSPACAPANTEAARGRSGARRSAPAAARENSP